MRELLRARAAACLPPDAMLRVDRKRALFVSDFADAAPALEHAGFAVEPRGALYCFPKLDTELFGIDDDEKFVIDLLRATKILVSHGTGFNWIAPDHFRLVALPEIDQLTDAIERIAGAVPEMVVGAGTITEPEQIKPAVAAGAQYLVTPGSTERLLDALDSAGVPFLAGASTVSEAMRLAERGLSAMKFFPAEQSGGVGFLKAVAGPLPQLRFCPTGGINPQNAASYLALPNVGCVGGSWLAPKDLLAAGEWGRVEELAREAASLR